MKFSKIKFLTSKIVYAENLNRPFTFAFEFKPDGKAPWLQKVIFWIALKLNCDVDQRETHVTRSVVDHDHFMANLHAQDVNIFEVYDAVGEYLLMGQGDFRFLSGTDENFNRAFKFDTQYYYNYSPGTIGHMRVVVVPWMEGIVLVPKLELRETEKG